MLDVTTRRVTGRVGIHTFIHAMDFFHEYGGDPFKPSLFELIAQEQLRDLLQPALKYVLSVSVTLSTTQSTASTDWGFSAGFRSKSPEVPSTDSQQA